MLFTLIKNELIKLLKKGKTWIVFGLFVVFIGLNVYSQYQGDKNYRYYTSMEYKLESSKNELDYTNGELENVGKGDLSNNPEYIESLNQRKVQLEEDIAKYEEKIKNGVTAEDEWKADIEENIKELNLRIADYEKYEDEWSAQYKEEAKQELARYEYLKENNIKPLYDWEYQSYGYMKNLMEFLGMAILLCGIAVFMSDIVSGECTPATLKFLLIQPVTRGKVLLSKFLAVAITVTTMIVGAELAGVAFINATSGIDGAAYPTQIGTVYEKATVNGYETLKGVVGSGHLGTNSELMIKSFLLQALFILTGCAVVFMISTLIKSSMITMAVSVISTVFITIASISISALGKVNHLIFVNYANTTNLVTGSIATQFNNVNMTMNTGILVMTTTIVISLAIAFINFNRKDILI